MNSNDRELKKAFKAGFDHGVQLHDWFRPTTDMNDFINRYWDKDIMGEPLKPSELKSRIVDEELTYLPSNLDKTSIKSWLRRLFK